MKCSKVLAKKSVKKCFEIKCNRCGTLNPFIDKMMNQVLITDADGRIVYFNEAVESATGYTIGESKGKKISDLWGGQMPKDFYKKMWGKIKGDKEKHHVRLTNKRKSGELYEVELLIFPITDMSNNVIFYIGIETRT